MTTQGSTAHWRHSSCDASSPIVNARFTPCRHLGRTRFRATRIGTGDVADRSLGLATCVATLARALDAGVNVVDTAPNYEDGFSEEIVGVAMRGRERGSVFIIDKIDHLDAQAGPQIDASLARLGLPYADAFVFHSVSRPEQWEALVRRGAFDELRECVGAGKARAGGISSHHPDVLHAALDAGVCDLVMFPLGPFVDRRYVEEILPRAKELGVATVTFKTFGAGKLVADSAGYNQPLPGGRTGLPRLSVRECIDYTLTLDPDVALLGMSTPEEQDAAFDAAARFAPLDSAAMDDIRGRAAVARREKGPCWWNPDPDA